MAANFPLAKEWVKCIPPLSYNQYIIVYFCIMYRTPCVNKHQFSEENIFSANAGKCHPKENRHNLLNCQDFLYTILRNHFYSDSKIFIFFIEIQRLNFIQNYHTAVWKTS